MQECYKTRNIRKLVPLGALNHIIQDQHSAVVAALEDQNILILGFLVVEDLVDLEVHGLAGPHDRLLGEPAIWGGIGSVNAKDIGDVMWEVGAG